MAPRLLVLVQSAGQTSVPIRSPEEWVGVACATCERVIHLDPVVYLISGEVRCRLCLESKPQTGGCTWCGRRPARIQDTGLRFCQPCWTIYVAYVADEVEPDISPFKQLTTDVWRVLVEEELRDLNPPPGEDRPTGERDSGPELGEDQ